MQIREKFPYLCFLIWTHHCNFTKVLSFKGYPQFLTVEKVLIRNYRLNQQVQAKPTQNGESNNNPNSKSKLAESLQSGITNSLTTGMKMLRNVESKIRKPSNSSSRKQSADSATLATPESVSPPAEPAPPKLGDFRFSYFFAEN